MVGSHSSSVLFTISFDHSLAMVYEIGVVKVCKNNHSCVDELVCAYIFFFFTIKTEIIIVITLQNISLAHTVKWYQQ